MRGASTRASASSWTAREVTRDAPQTTLWGGFEGQATDIEIHAREVIALKRRIEEIIAQHTGQPLETVSKDMERDYFMTSEQANQYGIIDQVIPNRIGTG